MLVKRAETFGHDDRVRQICLCTFVEEGTDGGGEGGAQRVRFYGAGAGAVETGESVRRKVVVASRLHSRQPATQARERQAVVAHGADIMLGLPDTAALDARACVKRVDDAPPEDVRRDRRRGNEQTPRLPGNLGLASSRLAKEKPESWARWTKVGRGRHRKVELKRVRQQEYAVDGRTVHKIGELYRPELIDERGRPIIENLGDRDVVGDAEGEVQVREAIAVAHSERTHGRAGYDAVILLGEPQHALAKGIPLLDGEHERRC